MSRGQASGSVGTRDRPPTFTERLATRARLWWHRPGNNLDPRGWADTLHVIRERNTFRHRDDPDDAWRCCRYWQRSLINKWNSREFAARHGIPLPELYWSGRDLARLDFSTLPARFVIRPTHGHAAKGVYVVRDGIDLMTGSPVDRQSLLAARRPAIGRLLHGQVLVEELISDPVSGGHPQEVRIMMFARQVGAIVVMQKDPAGTARRVFLSESLEPFPTTLVAGTESDVSIQPPGVLPQMVEAAREVAVRWDTFVRVDFRLAGDHFFFGEFSSIPGARWTPFAEEHLGGLWQSTFPDAI